MMAISPTPSTLRWVVWIFPLKPTDEQSKLQVSKVSPLSQIPFPHGSAGVGEAVAGEAELHPARLRLRTDKVSKVRIVEEIRERFILCSRVHCSMSQNLAVRVFRVSCS